MADAQLKIVAYDSPTGFSPSDETGDFTVDFNPATFTVTNKVSYKTTDAKGQDGGDPQFDKIPPLEFSVDFTIDGTGISPGGGTTDYVKQQLKKLRDITGCWINGEIHRPNYLGVIWGTFHLQCVLVSLTAVYNLFDREGRPLRAKVTCEFLERIGVGQSGRQSRLESPDLTKYVWTREGDLLPLIAEDKYDDAAYYLQVARVNKLKNFRRIAPGTKIVLPPMVS